MVNETPLNIAHFMVKHFDKVVKAIKGDIIISGMIILAETLGYGRELEVI